MTIKETNNVKIYNIVDSATREALDNAIKQEVQNFYKFGDGRKAVAEAVKKTLLSDFPDDI